MAGDVNLSISNDVIKSIVEAKIRSEVLTALSGNSEKLMEQLADNVIKQKVDREGRPSNSSYDTTNMLDWMVQKEIKIMAEKLIKEWLESQKEKLKISIKKSLDKNKDRFADDFVNSIISESKNGLAYRLSVSTPGFEDNLSKRVSNLEHKFKS